MSATRWQAGEAVVLLEAAVPSVEEAAFVDLLAMLERRNFLHSCTRVQGGLVERIADLCMQNGVGCRVDLDMEPVDGTFVSQVPPALVTCAAHAHLALVIVAERDGRFVARSLGRVTTAGIRIVHDGRELGPVDA